MEEEKNVYKVLVGRSEEKKSLKCGVLFEVRTGFLNNI
jgi:hypothetical protein